MREQQLVDKFALIRNLRVILGKIEVRGPEQGQYLHLVDQGLAALEEGLKQEQTETLFAKMGGAAPLQSENAGG